MSWQTKSWAVGIRNLGRALGLNRRIAARLYGRGYETRYDNAFTACLRQGDVVWDVGANVGYYTRLFVGRVGDTGQVVAFEHVGWGK
jgi:predicted methyltransferase